MASDKGGKMAVNTPPKSASKHSSFFFDFRAVMAHCETLRRHPERVALMCQAQIRQIAPEELLIPQKNGFHLVVQTCFGAAAEARAAEIHLALLQRLFGADLASQTAGMFRAGNVLTEFPHPLARAEQVAQPERVRNAVLSESSEALMSPAGANLKPGYIPVFHLQHKAPPIHLCGPVSARDGKIFFGTDALRYCHPQYRPPIDIAMLRYSLGQLSQTARGKPASAIVASVSYETIAWSRSRELYLDALQAAGLSKNARFILKLDDIPGGTPTCRMSEIIARLRPLVGRLFIELPARAANPAPEGYTGAAGYCTPVNAKMSAQEIAATASWLAQIATARRGLSCILGVRDGFTLRHLRDAGICLAAPHPERAGICFGDAPLNTEIEPPRCAA